MKNSEYTKLISKHSGKSESFKNCLWAFLVGGMICVIGQALSDLYFSLGINLQSAKTLTSISLIFLSILLTGLNIYPKIARKAGAGTLVPITGFANACASPAMEYKPEGHIFGIGANIFKISGPVIVYGLFAGWVYGVILWIVKLI